MNLIFLWFWIFFVYIFHGLASFCYPDPGRRHETDPDPKHCLYRINFFIRAYLNHFVFVFSFRQENFDILSCMQFSEIFKRQLYSQCSCCKVLLWIPISHFRWTLTPICEKYAGVYQTLWQSQIFKNLLFFEEVVWEHLRDSGRRIENFVCKQLAV